MNIILTILLSISSIPDSLLKDDLFLLPPKERTQILKKLEKVPVEDFYSLRAHKSGKLLYQDAGDLSWPTKIKYFEGNPYTLHSRPEASNILYLNVSGYNFSETVFADYDPTPPTIAIPSTLSTSEIYTIWLQVSEDFIPFDVDVTTEQPLSTNYGMIVITSDIDSNGDCLYECGWGGVAFIGDFGVTPAIVYENNILNASNIAEASSHEVGHLLNLHHDGTKGNRKTEYYRGTGNWAPIMGRSYNEEITQWSKGEYRHANNKEDDINIIKNFLGGTSDEDVINTSTDVNTFFYYTDIPMKLTVTPYGSWGHNLNVELFINNLVYNMRGASSHVILDSGNTEIGISGGLGIYHSEYGSLGRYKINFEPYNGVPPNIEKCGNIAKTTATSSYWYNATEGIYIGSGNRVILDSGEYTLLLDSSEGQALLPVYVKSKKQCKGF